MKKNVIRLLLVITIAALAVIFHKTGLLQNTLEWIKHRGIWSAVFFWGVYTASLIFFIPSYIFTFSGGALFGFWKGLSLSLLGIGTGSLCAFWIGRYLARDFVERKFSHLKDFSRIAGAVKKKGWKMILLARLSPVFPFFIGNYGFGVTQISAPQYFLASILGSIPSAAVCTYWGMMTGQLALADASGHEKRLGDWALLFLGLLATMLLAWYIRRIAQKDYDALN